MNRNYICPIVRPSKTLRNKLEQAFGSARWMYNQLLEYQENRYKQWKESGSKEDEKPYVDWQHFRKVATKIYSNADWHHTRYPGGASKYTYVAKNLGSAYTRWFERQKKNPNTTKGKPQFKTKHGKKSFSFQHFKEEDVIFKDEKIRIPNIGWVRIGDVPSWIQNRHIRMITVKQKGTRYYATLHCDLEPSEIKNLRRYTQNRAIGVDVGCKVLAATSDGVMYSRENLWRRRELLKQCQSKLDKAKNDGLDPKYINKLRKRVGNLHAKVERIQRDFSHKVSTIISENQTVVVEDLDVSNMIGTSKNLNRAISEAGMGGFLKILAYKVEARGGKLIKVDPAYTSRRCSECGHVSKRNRKTQENFLCIKCGHAENADVNAAKNILIAGGAGVTNMPLVAPYGANSGAGRTPVMGESEAPQWCVAPDNTPLSYRPKIPLSPLKNISCIP